MVGEISGRGGQFCLDEEELTLASVALVGTLTYAGRLLPQARSGREYAREAGAGTAVVVTGAIGRHGRICGGGSTTGRQAHSMPLAWDPEKAAENLRKHGVPFEEAATVFDAPLSKTLLDPDQSEGEERYSAMGSSSRRRLIPVSYPERCGKRRVVWARTSGETWLCTTPLIQCDRHGSAERYALYATYGG